MCERYVLPQQIDAEREFEPAQRWWKFASHFNVSFPQYVPVIRAHDGATEGVMMRWGLIPPEAEGVPLPDERPDFGFEHLGQTPDSREPWLNSQRCIVPVAGFYAWQLTPQGYRQPYFIGLNDRTVFGLAAFWTRSVSEEDDVIESCSIITVSANPLLAAILGSDGRMPAILRRKDYGAWLTSNPVQAKAALHAYPGQWMRAHAVSPRVNSVKYNDPSLIRPIDRAQILTG
jgi:putative SOS response-associated peptidase YedK